MTPLGLLVTGEKGEVAEIRKGLCRGGGVPGRMEDMGLRAGKTVEMLSNGGRGPILLKVDESRIAMGRGMAMKIMVRRKH
jgi:ferrous iron transport protein A